MWDLEGYGQDFHENDGSNALKDLDIESVAEELITISDFVTEMNKYFNNNRDDFMEAKRMIYFPPPSLENKYWVIEVAPDPRHLYGDMENPIFMRRSHCVGEDGSGPNTMCLLRVTLPVVLIENPQQSLLQDRYSTSRHQFLRTSKI